MENWVVSLNQNWTFLNSCNCNSFHWSSSNNANTNEMESLNSLFVFLLLLLQIEERWVNLYPKWIFFSLEVCRSEQADILQCLKHSIFFHFHRDKRIWTHSTAQMTILFALYCFFACSSLNGTNDSGDAMQTMYGKWIHANEHSQTKKVR